jgi:hypothetical protein
MLRSWRRLRFPFDKAAIRTAIEAINPNQTVVNSYLLGVIDGYGQATPEILGFAQNYARMHGKNDGGKLRRGELQVDDIPSPQGISVLRSNLCTEANCQSH